ncbi:hypothetical protein K7X08_028915 [Anisodus acutangulus]|uniref:Uncharacterized protein n=1 Tax=Anisodus acutangulus TaxID=402998 RepID=A0A9Q1L1Z7_9SOLA|nr:hypothetical protein K7X08_028915 [Anisodus acutangulus]
MILAGTYVPVHAIKLSISTLQVVVAPILLGSYLQSKFPRAVKIVTPFAPLLAVLTSSLLACSVFSENVVRLRSSMVGMSVSSDLSLFHRAQAILTSEYGAVVVSVLLLHSAGFFVGYLSAALSGLAEPQRRAISIEEEMQEDSTASDASQTEEAIVDDVMTVQRRSLAERLIPRHSMLFQIFQMLQPFISASVSNLADGISDEDEVFNECPQLVDSDELHSIKYTEQDRHMNIGSIGSTIAFQVGFQKKLVVMVMWKAKVLPELIS